MKCTFLLVMLASVCACGSPGPNAGAGAPASAGRNLKLDRFTIRFQAGSLRTVEISGDSAALNGNDRVDMDSVTLVFFKDNLPFLRLTARAARASAGSADSGVVTIWDGDGRLHYGGRFRAGTMKLFFAEDAWQASVVEFDRPPMGLTAALARGPFGMEEINAASGEVRAEGSTASADSLRFLPKSLELRLRGHARFRSDTVQLRQDSINLGFDPTFSVLTPLTGPAAY